MAKGKQMMMLMGYGLLKTPLTATLSLSGFRNLLPKQPGRLYKNKPSPWCSRSSIQVALTQPVAQAEP
eukprot:jgi/Phyca11/504498/fgenesh2_kg.PHYCAscaffold_8_\